MSLDPTWYSTIFGMFFMISEMLSMMALLIVILCSLRAFAPYNRVLGPGQLHDYGKLMLTFTMVWAYFSFSQWLIIWAGNLPEEITWYLDRIHGGWQMVALSLVLLQFSLPFLLLLSRDLKRDARKLVPVALLVLVMRYVDLYWLVAPNPFPGATRTRTILPITGRILWRRSHWCASGWGCSSANSAPVLCWWSPSRCCRAYGSRTMATDHGQHSNDERNPSVVFDKSDLGARGILIFFLVLAIFAVCANLVVLGLYAGMTKFAEKHEHETSPLAPKTVTPRAGVLANTADVNIRRFPEPRLLDDDTAPLKNFELKESAALTASSWQDAQGNTHPPIDDAMKAVVNNLPVRAGSSGIDELPRRWTSSTPIQPHQTQMPFSRRWASRSKAAIMAPAQIISP